MRALLVLRLVIDADEQNPDRGLIREATANLKAWGTGLAYLLPVSGGVIADDLIGTHR